MANEDKKTKIRPNIDHRKQGAASEGGKKPTVVIITGGEKPDYAEVAAKIAEADIIICADSGGDYAYAHGVLPDYLLGDFDSISSEAKDFFSSRGVQLRSVPVEKDFTDTQMAIDMAMGYAPDTLYICGGWGSRADHSLANIFLLCRYLECVPKIVLLGKGFCGYYTQGDLEIHGVPGQTVSIIPIKGDVTGLRLDGFYYPLKGELLPWGSSRGISNVLLASHGKICHEEGILLVIQHMGQPE